MLMKLTHLAHLIVLEKEGLRARASRVPLVTLPRVRPIILIVSGRASALAPERFSGIFFEDDEFAQRARASAADLRNWNFQ